VFHRLGRPSPSSISTGTTPGYRVSSGHRPSPSRSTRRVRRRVFLPFAVPQVAGTGVARQDQVVEPQPDTLRGDPLLRDVDRPHTSEVHRHVPPGSKDRSDGPRDVRGREPGRGDLVDFQRPPRCGSEVWSLSGGPTGSDPKAAALTTDRYPASTGSDRAARGLARCGTARARPLGAPRGLSSHSSRASRPRQVPRGECGQGGLHSGAWVWVRSARSLRPTPIASVSGGGCRMM
jgi:hypothetical protein